MPRSPGKSVYLETFGCQMNVLDSELVASQLRGLGYALTDDRQAADVVLFNTCSVREQAENKVYSRLGELRDKRPGVVIGVLGCMAERDGQDMARRIPQVDLMCGPGELDKVPMLIDNAIKTHDKQIALQGNTAAAARSPRRKISLNCSTCRAHSRRMSTTGRPMCASRAGATSSAPTASYRSRAARRCIARRITLWMNAGGWPTRA